MTSKEIRKKFFEFFESKNHEIYSSAPIVVKDDPTLMFVNAGMNQFKDIFLGLKQATHPRVANSQKCLRVSGKHNDLEEVGHDGYHHTMFEMLGNWSFNDYFKKEAIAYAWEFLTGVLKIDKYRLYVTVFEGDKKEGLEKDTEAYEYWKQHISEDRILFGNKKDNFWEMGEQGPCGPSSEIHIDIRSEEDRQKIPGKELVNKGNPEVIELWNLVFIQYNRNADGTLSELSGKFIDTGMGLERLAMVIQGKKSNYDTDLFMPLIHTVEQLTGIKYGTSRETDTAMRVISDHIRAIAFTIADGQLPSNTGAGYVIRRILRRAIRYGFTFLNLKQPFLYKLLPALNEILGENYPELVKQQQFIEKVILEEEKSFLKTLETGLKLLNIIIDKTKKDGKKEVPGKVAFELYDTYGFPKDLTALILKEQGLYFNEEEFAAEMKKQKERSRTATSQTTSDWIIIKEDDKEEFVGYDRTETNVYITKYKSVEKKNKKFYHLVFSITPFYPESGGQVGDTGYIINDEGEKIKIIDTQKEHNVIIHITKELPKNLSAKFKAVVDKKRREKITANHSATHLLHYALRKVLGSHVEQRGSLVTDTHLRFDFSHFQKLSDEEITAVEKTVNEMIRADYHLNEMRNVPFEEAIKKGAMALFGEKYGDTVRVIQFGESVELCGGTHVQSTGRIGCFKITLETSVAAGIRRIEAVTGEGAEEYIDEKITELKKIASLFNNRKDLYLAVEKLAEENEELQKQVNNLLKEKADRMLNDLINSATTENGIKFITGILPLDNANQLKQIGFDIRKKSDNTVAIIGAKIKDKPNLMIAITDDLVSSKNLNAGKIIREAAQSIKGGGGGQPFLATAGGKEVSGLNDAINKAKQIILQS